MIYPDLAAGTDAALLFLRLCLSLPLASSGWRHARQPEQRGEDIGLAPAATLALGVVEVVAALMLVVGLGVQIAAVAVVAVMAGALQRKIFVWGTGLWGEKREGWYYEVLYVACAVVLLTTGGGSLGLT